MMIKTASIKLFTQEDTNLFSRILEKVLEPGHIVFLKGDLGAGKSTLVRHFIQNQQGEAYAVASPTFSLFIPHDDLQKPVLHADMYRLEDPEDCFELGFEDYLDSHIFFIEWPEKMPKDYLTADLILTLSQLEKEERRITLTGRLAGPVLAHHAQEIKT